MATVGEAFIQLKPLGGASFTGAAKKDVEESLNKLTTSGSGTGIASKLKGAFGGVADTLKTVAGAALGVGVAFEGGKFLSESVSAAKEAEKTDALLAQAIKNVGGNAKALAPEIDRIVKQYEVWGYTSDDAKSALQRLIGATGSTKKAMGDMALVANVARARNIDLSSAAQLVARVQNGAVAVLNRLGIANTLVNGTLQAQQKNAQSLEKAHAKLVEVQGKISAGHLKGAAAADALQKAQQAVAVAQDKLTASQTAGSDAVKLLNERFGGAAGAAADTYAGHLDALRAKWHDVQVTVGEQLIKVINEVLPIVLHFVSQIQSWVSAHWDQIRKVTQVIWGELSKFIRATMTTVGAIIKDVIAIIEAIWQRWGKNIMDFAIHFWTAIKNEITYAIDIVRDVIKFVLDVIQGHWSAAWHALLDILRKVWDLIGNYLTYAWDLIKNIFEVAFDVIKGIVLGGLRFIANIFLTAAGWIIHAAAAAFGWIPGIGGKLKAAARAFDQFKKDVNNALGGVKQNVAVAVTGALTYTNGPGGPDVTVRTHTSSSSSSGGSTGSSGGSGSAPVTRSAPSGAPIGAPAASPVLALKVDSRVLAAALIPQLRALEAVTP